MSLKLRLINIPDGFKRGVKVLYLNYNDMNLVTTRGDTIQFAVEIDGMEGTDADAMNFTVKKNIDDTAFVIRKTLNDGITKIDDTHYRVRVAPAETENLEIGNYYYDLEMTVDSDKYTLLKGRLKVDYDIG